MEKIARGRGRETNTARGKAECCIRFECYFSILHKHGSALTGVLK